MNKNTTSLSKPKRQHGDRVDARLIHETDGLHAIMPHMLPNRTDNEALLTETIDLTAINEYLKQKNTPELEFKYTFFHVICAALAKTIALRPRLNRFYAGGKMYERNDISLAFVVKKAFTDDGAESLAILTMDRETDEGILPHLHEQIRKVVYSTRHTEGSNGTVNKVGILTKLPGFLLHFAMRTLNWLNEIGHYPEVCRIDDPYFATVFVSNLGSIKMHADYHHLANWGTNSIFAIIGEKMPTAFFEMDGSYEVREALEIGLTIDERIADGVYFAKSIKLFKHLLANPELLERPLMEQVEF